MQLLLLEGDLVSAAAIFSFSDDMLYCLRAGTDHVRSYATTESEVITSRGKIMQVLACDSFITMTVSSLYLPTENSVTTIYFSIPQFDFAFKGISLF